MVIGCAEWLSAAPNGYLPAAEWLSLTANENGG
jgi:hypothetical protein